MDISKCTDPDILKKQLENTLDNFRFNRYELLLKISELYKKKDKTEEANYAQYESAAFSLIVDMPNITFPGHFQPLIVYSDGSTIPSVDYFSKTVLDYLESRAISTKNPILSARFSDVVWDFRKGDVKIAKIAIDRYIECIGIYKKNLWAQEYASSISRAIQLASMINDSEYLLKLKVFSFKQLSALEKEEDYRYCIEIGEALANSKIQLDKNEEKDIITIFQKGIQYYTNNHEKNSKKLGPVDGPNDHLSNMLNNTLLSLHFKKKIKINVNDIKKKIAESYEKRGDEFFNAKNFIGSLMHYTKSEKIYVEIGLPEKSKEVRIKILNAGLKNYKNLNEISVETNIEKEKFDLYFKHLIGKNIKESLKLLSTAPHFIPITKDIEKLTDKLQDKFPLQAIIPKVLVDEKGSVQIVSEDEDIKNESVVCNMILDIKIGNIFLHQMFEELKKSQGLNPSVLTQHFHEWGYCTEDNIKILNLGFEHYFKGDFVSAIHLLIFQFEDLLRNLLRAAGVSIITPEKFSLLDTLIKNEKLESVGGKDLIEYYEVSLTRHNGLNLRNNIAHGLLPVKEMNDFTVERIIHLLLTLTRFKISNQEQK